MHELAICEALVGQLAEISARHGWSHLRRVRVRVGMLSGVVAEAMEFTFEAIADGTPAEGAELVLENEPGQFNCAACGDLELDRLRFACPHCDAPLKLLHAGRGLILEEVEPRIS
jgi:hydrogenase nickel incorporation protein HypA/HybF